ncbi:DUF29 domain-containing protein [Acidisoma cellulosilytica]|uniref:DUF29 domain-containing protein n=1 Tax=Acidisoma cellulosilyticum TaxID=2802395 RepID=A0A963Z7W8_9PROT|nr:DUF29 domain-containing protein [Acidisoma cellulosilyticum]MCB8883478.1 DUF29 domain-containing protein [Acidisoma cellulosilyticum]
MSETYDSDFYAWANEQAALLRAGRLADADIANIAEEIESMGRSEKRELINRLALLIQHLLKWQYQPDRRGKSWRVTIMNNRRQLVRHLRDNPSLKALLPQAVTDAYGDAVLDVVVETGLDDSVFPSGCPWSFDQIMDQDFWPV